MVISTVKLTGEPHEARLTARFAQPASLLILSCTILFGLPLAVGLVGIVIGAAALFIPASWEA